MNLYTAIITLVLIMDPFGNIPIFLTTLELFSPKRRRAIILRESFFAFLILVFFLFFGQYFLMGLNISQPALSISGGIILFLIAIKMIFPGPEKNLGSSSDEERPVSKKEPEDPILFPLAVPMQAGPSAMAFVILSSTQYSSQRMMLTLALLSASLICTTILLLSDCLRKILGIQVLRAIEKLMGMILTTMSIQMLLTGITTYFSK